MTTFTREAESRSFIFKDYRSLDSTTYRSNVIIDEISSVGVDGATVGPRTFARLVSSYSICNDPSRLLIKRRHSNTAHLAPSPVADATSGNKYNSKDQTISDTGTPQSDTITTFLYGRTIRLDSMDSFYFPGHVLASTEIVNYATDPSFGYGVVRLSGTNTTGSYTSPIMIPGHSSGETEESYKKVFVRVNMEDKDGSISYRIYGKDESGSVDELTDGGQTGEDCVVFAKETDEKYYLYIIFTYSRPTGTDDSPLLYSVDVYNHSDDLGHEIYNNWYKGYSIDDIVAPLKRVVVGFDDRYEDIKMIIKGAVTDKSELFTIYNEKSVSTINAIDDPFSNSSISESLWKVQSSFDETPPSVSRGWGENDVTETTYLAMTAGASGTSKYGHAAIFSNYSLVGEFDVSVSFSNFNVSGGAGANASAYLGVYNKGQTHGWEIGISVSGGSYKISVWEFNYGSRVEVDTTAYGTTSGQLKIVREFDESIIGKSTVKLYYYSGGWTQLGTAKDIDNGEVVISVADRIFNDQSESTVRWTGFSGNTIDTIIPNNYINSVTVNLDTPMYLQYLFVYVMGTDMDSNPISGVTLYELNSTDVSDDIMDSGLSINMEINDDGDLKLPVALLSLNNTDGTYSSLNIDSMFGVYGDILNHNYDSDGNILMLIGSVINTSTSDSNVLGVSVSGGAKLGHSVNLPMIYATTPDILINNYIIRNVKSNTPALLDSTVSS
jgi:hypothetical protein